MQGMELYIIILFVLTGIVITVIKNISWQKKLKSGLSKKTHRGDFVQSWGEVEIADFLYDNNVKYVYDKPTRFSFFQRTSIRPDFYLPEFDVYIEYWGMRGNTDYDRKTEWKQKIYKKYNKKLINLYKEDKKNIPEILRNKLGLNNRGH